MRELTDTQKYTGPCLKAANRMCAAWGLSADESNAMTGVPDLRGTETRFLAGEPVALTDAQLYRISVMLCVWKHVAWRFADHGAAWMREPNELYQDVPLRMMTGTMDEILSVRAAFDAAEAQMMSGYALPAYPVKNFVHPNFDVEGPRFGRIDGGPGRIATDAEIDASFSETDADASPVIDYLRDK